MSLRGNNQAEDLFADNYPPTVTPIHCNADLELSDVEDAEDITKISQRILAHPLRTYESEKTCASSAMLQRDSFHNTKGYDDEWHTTNRPRQEKNIRFNNCPLGPTSGYSQKCVSLSQPTNNSSDYSEMPRFGQFDHYSSHSSNMASSANKQQGHIAAASTLFRNVFNRSSSNCGTCPSNLLSQHVSEDDLFSSCAGHSSHSLQSPTVEFINDQHKKRIRIHGLMQTRAYLSCHSDCDDYMLALETNSVPASSSSDYAIINRYQFQDEKLMMNCAVIIEPSPEIIQYERKRDVMYNEILQKQRRKMELRAIEKMKEKERRRQEKETKLDQYLREQRETIRKPKPKSHAKTVTFNPRAEVIPISPNNNYDKRCIIDRDETPPPEDFYRDHDYDRRPQNGEKSIRFRYSSHKETL